MDAESLARQHARFRKEVRNMEQECKSLRQRLLFSADEVKRAQDFIERAESLSAEISMVSDASLEGDTPVIEAEAQSLLEEVTSIEGEYQELRERLPWSAGTASNAKEISRKMAQLQRRFSVLQQKELPVRTCRKCSTIQTRMSFRRVRPCLVRAPIQVRARGRPDRRDGAHRGQR